MRHFIAVILLLAVLCGCGEARLSYPGVGRFTMSAFPGTMPGVPGERCVVFVQIEEESPGSASMPVTISAISSDAAILVENSQFELGPVAEVTIIPNQPNAAQAELDTYWISATIVGKRAAYIQASELQFEVHNGFSDDIWQQADVERGKFANWLAENHPEFEIDASSEWTGTMPYPVLVVFHYLYFNDEWEMHVYWHNMIPPWDWTRMDLRKRFVETEPSIAFELSTGNPVPREIEPEGLWRSLF